MTRAGRCANDAQRLLIQALGILSMKFWKYINRISLIYLVIVLLAIPSAILVTSSSEHGIKPEGFIGCHSYDAMLIAYKCMGFVGADIVEKFINLPLFILYSTMFSFSDLRFTLLAIIFWSLPVLFVISVFKLKKANA